MIPKKEFYFVRHGQTDQNVTGIYTNDDIPINSTGFLQAKAIEETISELPIKSICHSPFLRARQTKEVITPRIAAPHYELLDLGECTIDIWNAMTALGDKAFHSDIPPVKAFMQAVLNGVTESLSYPGPVLIVAHGGVHWAICNFMKISTPWVIGNCVPVHFTVDEKGNWVHRVIKGNK